MHIIEFFAAHFNLDAVIIIAAIFSYKSIIRIGPTQIGLVGKRWSFRSLHGTNPVAFRGEAGYQAKLLMPGIKYILWPLYWVERHDWVQVPPGEIGIVISQVGDALPEGARTAIYAEHFNNFTDLTAFVEGINGNNKGQKGIQRKVLPPGTLLPLHPVAFVVLTKRKVYGVPLTDISKLSLPEASYNLINVPSAASAASGGKDVIGVVTAFEGEPLESGDIASRLDGFNDIDKAESGDKADSDLVEIILGTKNHLHHNYQDAQAFLNAGGKVGVQHDPLLPGSYVINPFVFSVALMPMLVVEQGQVAVIKAYVGQPTKNTDQDFKFGALVRPGHRGVWREPVRTGKYAINPHCYAYEIVRTSIITLEWSKVEGKAFELDRNLCQISGKSREGFDFFIDLHVQIHVADVEAPRVICMVGTMQNLVDEVLQSAVGNHFRDKLQSLTAVKFIEERQQVQEEATAHIKAQLIEYHVETKGVYIQDIVMPNELTAVLKERLIATEQKDTYEAQQQAQMQRLQMEKARGMADNQVKLAESEVGMTVAANKATARKSEADGEAAYIQQTASAEGLGKAEGYLKQVEALGQTGTTLVNAISSLKDGMRIMPEVFVGNGGNIIDAVAARFTMNGVKGEDNNG